MKLYFLVGLLALTSCDVVNREILHKKKTKADVISEKGEPLKTEQIPVKEGEMLVYPKNEKYQIVKDTVVAKFRDPSENEKALIYWKHKFKDCSTVTREFPAPKNSHTEPEMELTCETTGESVVYSEHTGFVSRVIEHEK